MSKVLAIKSVKCISPSSGISPLTRTIFGNIGAAAVGAAKSVPGGVLIAKLIPGGGESAGVALIDGLDRVFSGSDDLYIKLNGTKVWPKDRKYTSANSQQTLAVDHNMELTNKPVRIELFDYDSVSSDDLLGYLEIPADHTPGRFTYLVRSDAEGSIYEVNISVGNNINRLEPHEHIERRSHK